MRCLRRGRFFRCHKDSRRQDNGKETGQRAGGVKETVHFHSGQWISCESVSSVPTRRMNSRPIL